MPLPLILAVPALISVSAAGAKKTVDGVGKIRDAKRIDGEARARYERGVAGLQRAETRCAQELASLGKERQLVFEQTMPEFIGVLSRLRNAEVAAEAFNDNFSVADVPPGALHDIALKQMQLLGNAAASVVGGAVASQAATVAVTSFAAASTGTAISGLSGAAAANATLAWLGGGTLASGGLGVAGGTAVLGGIMVAPAVLIGGLLLDRQGAKMVERARTNAAEVEGAVAKLGVAERRADLIRKTAKGATPVLRQLRGRLAEYTQLIAGFAAEEPDVQLWSADRQSRLRDAGNTAGLLVALAAAPLITEDGDVDQRFTAAAERARG